MSSFWFSKLSVTAHSPTLPSLYLCHNSFSNPSVASLTSQLILQPFFRLSYITGFSLTSPGDPPMVRGQVWTRRIEVKIQLFIARDQTWDVSVNSKNKMYEQMSILAANDLMYENMITVSGGQLWITSKCEFKAMSTFSYKIFHSVAPHSIASS